MKWVLAWGKKGSLKFWIQSLTSIKEGKRDDGKSAERMLVTGGSMGRLRKVLGAAFTGGSPRGRGCAKLLPSEKGECTENRFS